MTEGTFDWVNLLRHTSRSFVVGIQALESPLDEKVGVSYLLCRLLDTYEDSTDVQIRIRRAALIRNREILSAFEGGSDVSELEPLLSHWDTTHDFTGGHWKGINPWELQILESGPMLWKKLFAFPAEDRRAIGRAVGDMADGMIQELNREDQGDVSHGRTPAQVDSYCYYVAGTVGLLLNHLFSSALGARVKLEDTEAISFGKLLQLVNITKDFHKDWKEGRCFWPGIDPPAAKHPAPSVAKLKESFAELLQLFHENLEPTRRYLERIKTAGASSRMDIYFFCAFPYRIALHTMDLAKQSTTWLENPEQVLKIPRELTESVISELSQECGQLPK